MVKYSMKVKARLKNTGEEIKVLSYDPPVDQFEVQFEDGTYKVVNGDEVIDFNYPSDEITCTTEEKLNSYFENRATNIGKLVDTKQRAYGDSVTKTYDLMKIFLSQYKNEDNTYTIPESLLKHILLQVRIIDKQNRIFSNPEGDLMGENPYQDTVGYGLIGVRMCDENN